VSPPSTFEGADTKTRLLTMYFRRNNDILIAEDTRFFSAKLSCWRVEIFPFRNLRRGHGDTTNIGRRYQDCLRVGAHTISEDFIVSSPSPF
jgi:hypothetical protein